MNRKGLTKIGITEIELEKILDFLPYPFIVSETQNAVQRNLFVNKRFIEEIGYTCEEMPSINDWFEKAYPDPFYHNEIIQEWTQRETSAKKQGLDSVVMQAKIHTKLKGDKWYEVKASLHGRIHFIAFVNIDEEITRKLELKRLNENKNRTLSILSHDLRSPLNNLYTILRMTIQGDINESEKYDALKKISNQVFQLSEFVDTTLQWTKINFDELKTSNESIDVRRHIENIMTVYQNGYLEKRIQIELKIDETPLWSDPGIFSILFRNLISNAIKFTPESGCIIITGTPEASRYTLTVENTGEPISPQRISEILDKNYRSQDGTQGEKGLGLGLRLCQQLLEHIGGYIQIASKKPNTTTVRLIF